MKDSAFWSGVTLLGVFVGLGAAAGGIVGAVRGKNLPGSVSDTKTGALVGAVAFPVVLGIRALSES